MPVGKLLVLAFQFLKMSQTNKTITQQLANGLLKITDIVTMISMVILVFLALGLKYKEYTEYHPFCFSTIIFLSLNVTTRSDEDLIIPKNVQVLFAVASWAAYACVYVLTSVLDVTNVQLIGYMFLSWPTLYIVYKYLDSMYGRDARFAREHPEIVAQRAAEERKKREAYELTEEYMRDKATTESCIFVISAALVCTLYAFGLFDTPLEKLYKLFNM